MCKSKYSSLTKLTFFNKVNRVESVAVARCCLPMITWSFLLLLCIVLFRVMLLCDFIICIGSIQNMYSVLSMHSNVHSHHFPLTSSH